MYVCQFLGRSINHSQGEVKGSLHTDRDLSPSKLSQASGPTAASQRWNLLSNNNQAQGVSAPTSLKWNSSGGTVAVYQHHYFLPQTCGEDCLKACAAVTLLIVHRANPSHHCLSLNSYRVLSQQAKSSQKSPLFLSVYALKHGVSPGCGSTDVHACAPTLGCTCACKKQTLT